MNSEQKEKKKIDGPLRLCEFVRHREIHSPHLPQPAPGIYSAAQSIKLDTQN